MDELLKDHETAKAHLSALCHAYETAPVTNAGLIEGIASAALRVHALDHAIEAATAPADKMPEPASKDDDQGDDGTDPA